jgi:DNA ligase-1
MACRRSAINTAGSFTPEPAMHLPHCHRRRLLGGLLAFPLFPALAQARPAQDRLPLPLLLAQEARADIDPAGRLVSEKYDGARALWDGSRLRFRSGLPVAAPAWFTAFLPATPLDGELWLGRGRFEALSAAVRRHVPDDAEWRQIRYMVFELPAAGGRFAERAAAIESLVRETGAPALVAVAQSRLGGREALRQRLAEVVRGGGEGLVLHRADAPVQSGRSGALLKLKPVQDAEAVVTAHLPGRGRHAGRLGALRVRTDEGVVFDLGTGFSDAVRQAPPPLGSRVTFTYRGSTEGGVPRFASFLRLREL